MSSKPLQWHHGLLFIALALFLLLFSLAVTFFYTVRPPETVLVPNLLEYSLEDAVLELQQKELNIRLQKRFSNSNVSKDLILEQSPRGGSNVPIRSNVLVTINAGTLSRQTPNFIGTSITNLEQELAQYSRDEGGLEIKVERQIFIESDRAAGTVLQQFPAPGRAFSEETLNLQLWISRGEGNFKYQMPSYIGRDAFEVARELAQQDQAFIMSLDESQVDEETSLIVTQQPASQTSIDNTETYNFTINSIVAPERFVFGIFTYDLSLYPAAVNINLTARLPNQLQESLLQTSHLGGRITFPYLLPIGSELQLTVNGQTIETVQVIN